MNIVQHTDLSTAEYILRVADNHKYVPFLKGDSLSFPTQAMRLRPRSDLEFILVLVIVSSFEYVISPRTIAEMKKPHTTLSCKDMRF